jgi:uncharacterized membrane protein
MSATGTVHVAVYSEEQAARNEFQRLHDLAGQGRMATDALALVHRDDEGKIHIDSDTHKKRRGAVLGTVGGVVVGAVFPPAVLAAGAVGAALGTGIGGLVSRHKTHHVAAEVDQALPRGGWAVVALLADEATVEFAGADLVVSHPVESEQVARAKAAALYPEGPIAGDRSPMIG